MSRIRPALDRTPRTGPQPAPDGLSLAQVPRVLRRSLGWIVGPTLVVALGLSTSSSTWCSPRYTGEAKLLLESRDAAFARTAQERADQLAPIDEQAVASQVQVVMSRDLAREAIRRLKLVGNPEFDPGAGSIGPVQRILMMLGLGARTPSTVRPRTGCSTPISSTCWSIPAGKSRILTRSSSARRTRSSPPRAPTPYRELYIAVAGGRQGRYGPLRVDLARRQHRRPAQARRRGGGEGRGVPRQERPRRAAPAPPAGRSTRSSSANCRPSSPQARILKADLAGRVKAIKDLIKDGRAFEIPDVANNEVIRRIVENRITVRAQLALESRTLLAAHPRIKELNAQLEDLDAQIKASAERDRAHHGERRQDRRPHASRASRPPWTASSDVVVKGNSSEIQLRALEREAKVQREQLESYLSRYREAAARDGESATPGRCAHRLPGGDAGGARPSRRSCRSSPSRPC